MTTTTLFDTATARANTVAVSYRCPICPNRVTIHVEHVHAPTCHNRHDRRTMNREENGR